LLSFFSSPAETRIKTVVFLPFSPLIASRQKPFRLFSPSQSARQDYCVFFFPPLSVIWSCIAPLLFPPFLQFNLMPRGMRWKRKARLPPSSSLPFRSLKITPSLTSLPPFLSPLLAREGDKMEVRNFFFLLFSLFGPQTRKTTS